MSQNVADDLRWRSLIDLATRVAVPQRVTTKEPSRYSGIKRAFLHDMTDGARGERMMRGAHSDEQLPRGGIPSAAMAEIGNHCPCHGGKQGQ
jgi:hypothetical protein